MGEHWDEKQALLFRRRETFSITGFYALVKLTGPYEDGLINQKLNFQNNIHRQNRFSGKHHGQKNKGNFYIELTFGIGKKISDVLLSHFQNHYEVWEAMSINYAKTKVTALAKQQKWSHLFETKCPNMLMKTKTNCISLGYSINHRRQ